MSRLFSDRTKSITPYIPGEQPKDKKYIKLNTNENPYPPCPKVFDVIKNFKTEDLKLYPDPECSELKGEIASYYGLEEKQVFVGNGSDEVLAFIFPAFFNPKDKVLFPDVTYSFYPVYSELYDICYETIPLKQDFKIDIDDYIKECKGIFIANPNAPTGIFTELSQIEKLLIKNRDTLIVVDEAYIDFGGETAVQLVKKYDNLIVVQTLSKSRSLAGMRIGFALGNPELIDGLERIKNSFNSYTLDRMAISTSIEAIKDKEYFKKTTKEIISTRERVKQELDKLGVVFTDSKTNFLFVSIPGKKGEEVFNELKSNGILVRHFNKPRISDYLRITIGTDEEMNILIDNIKSIIEK